MGRTQESSMHRCVIGLNLVTLKPKRRRRHIGLQGLNSGTIHGRPIRVEFWVRFVCGAAFGVMPAVNLVVFGIYQYPRSIVILLVSAVILMVGCGLGAARYGDKFWYEVVLSRWQW